MRVIQIVEFDNACDIEYNDCFFVEELIHV